MMRRYGCSANTAASTAATVAVSASSPVMPRRSISKDAEDGEEGEDGEPERTGGRALPPELRLPLALLRNSEPLFRRAVPPTPRPWVHQTLSHDRLPVDCPP